MLSVVIPTYNRERVLLETIEQLLRLSPAPQEILIVDQTERHETETDEALRRFEAAREIRWIRTSPPSIPRAMNRGLLEARGRFVLFLDDDIIPDEGLIAAHRDAHAADRMRVVAGRVIQPWQEGVDFSADAAFHFASTRPREIEHFMGGNFSLCRKTALALGGFDENFVKVAYGFEAEFAFRWRRAGGMICFEPGATIHHLKSRAGGTRAFGDHLTTAQPHHSVGAYYCVLRTWTGPESIGPFILRPMRAVSTRFHLRRPWQIPVTLLAELRGMIWALRLASRGPAYVGAARCGDIDDV